MLSPAAETKKLPHHEAGLPEKYVVPAIDSSAYN